MNCMVGLCCDGQIRRRFRHPQVTASHPRWRAAEERAPLRQEVPIPSVPHRAGWRLVNGPCFQLLLPSYEAPLAGCWGRVRLHPQRLQADSLGGEHPLLTSLRPSRLTLVEVHGDLKHGSIVYTVVEELMRNAVASCCAYLWRTIHAWHPQIVPEVTVVRLEQYLGIENGPDGLPTGSMKSLHPVS